MFCPRRESYARRALVPHILEDSVSPRHGLDHGTLGPSGGGVSPGWCAIAIMSEFSRRPHYDDEPQSDEEDAVADSGTELSYRRLQVPASGEPTASAVFPDEGEKARRTQGRRDVPHRRVCHQQAQIELEGFEL